jgi:leucyl-tRNA synthetase
MPPITDQDQKNTRDERYDAQRIETKWYERWQQDPALYAAEASSTKPKYYVLEMLPYP